MEMKLELRLLTGESSVVAGHYDVELAVERERLGESGRRRRQKKETGRKRNG